MWAGRSGSTMNSTCISRPSCGANSWLVKQKQCTFLKNFAALPGDTLVGHATPSVSPGSAAKFFKKVQCFCFTSQEFAPHEGREMQVLFMVDPDLPAHLDTLTLGYTFFALDQRS